MSEASHTVQKNECISEYTYRELQAERQLKKKMFIVEFG